MNSSATSQDLATADRVRIAFVAFRYDFCLDLHSVPRNRRRALRAELKSNLNDAAHDVGVRSALSSLGSVRTLAAETTRDGQLRSRWTAGWVAGATALAILLTTFSFLMLYWTEGVLDAGAAEPVRSSLFPFFGSTVEVDPADGGVVWSMQPGPVPFVVGLVVWLFVAKPWRHLVSAQK